jgi:hypothetical protein
MGLLSAEIANESSPAHVRQSAALALKNQLTAKVSFQWRDEKLIARNKRDEMNIKQNGLLWIQKSKLQ